MKSIACSVCKRPIRTAFGSALNKIRPVVCRNCFGEQSYGGSAASKYSPVPAAQMGGTDRAS